ncbi:MAG: glycosyltransferase family 4 protein [Salibacteraceae bacterium]
MSSSKPSLYFISTEVPWPATSGGRIKTFRFLKFLSNHYDVRLVCAYGSNQEATLTALRKASGIISVQVFGEQKPRTLLNWFMAIMQFPTFNCFRVYSKKMESIIQWGIEQSDITIVDHLEMLEMIPQRLISKIVYHSHNAEFKLWSDFAELEKNPLKKWFLEWEAERVRVFERWAIRNTKFTFAAPNDSAMIVDKSDLDPQKFRLTYHLGNEAYLTSPPINLDENKPRVFFGGTLNWMPNLDGITWFMKTIWPDVKAAIPEAELVVCGSGASKPLIDHFRRTKGVDYKGFVPDVEDVMKECRCAIVPLRFGSGMKIKTLDALYRGLPLLSTETGVEGIDLQNGIHAIVTSSENQWISSLTTLLKDPKAGSDMSLAGRSLVAAKYTYPLIFPQMLEALKQ